MRFAAILLAAIALPMRAQEIKLPAHLDALAAKAEESVNVTLDKSMLQLARKFLSDKDPDEARARQLIAGLDGIYVRSFEFAAPGGYTAADVEAIRAQLQAPGWSRVVGVKSKLSGEDVDVYFKDAGGGRLGGIVVIDAEATELTIVNILGVLDPAQLSDLGGQFGIPRFTASGHAWRRL
jgi:Domain of unknown function (DUF4252)